LAITWGGESNFSFYPTSQAVNIPNVGETVDVGPMQLNVYYTYDDIKRGAISLGPYALEHVFGTALGDGEKFNGSPWANLSLGSRKLAYLTQINNNNESKAAEAYVGHSEARKQQYNNFAPQYNIFFNCYRRKVGGE
jgi:hypothetical protein